MSGDRFDRILSRYGQDAVLFTAEYPDGKPVKAMIQRLRERGTAQAVPTSVGWERRDRCLYLGPAEVSIDCGDCVIESGGEKYRPLAAEPIYVGERLSHWWAVLEHRAGEANG